jgi:two-component system nitrogen regulation response regulator NtrX
MVQGGEFREDLYFRLNVFPIMVPPLRQRPDDIPLLINHFLTRFCLKNNRHPVTVDPEVVEILKTYHWPGNIRELQNVVERLLILSEGEKIGIRHLPQNLLAAPAAIVDSAAGELSLKQVREAAERRFIEACLKKCGGNVSEAARLMGIERTNLHKKIKILKIDSGE